MHEDHVAAALAAPLGGRWNVRALGVSGFCETWAAESGPLRLFVKGVEAGRADVLQAEADGLRALGGTHTIRVPQVAWQGAVAGGELLAMEWLALKPPDAGFGARLGQALGALHQSPCPLQPSRYGWNRPNFIGATPQRNDPSAGDALPDWIGFMRTQRLQPMRERLAARGAHRELLDAITAVSERLPSFFQDGHEPRPSLVHGDLWAGNWGMLGDGSPVIFDPAVSGSDAEAELAMMELFGPLPAGFLASYAACAGLHPGYGRRRRVYQLYHLLNHALLFGGGYASQALACARTLLASPAQ